MIRKSLLTTKFHACLAKVFLHYLHPVGNLSYWAEAPVHGERKTSTSTKLEAEKCLGGCKLDRSDEWRTVYSHFNTSPFLFLSDNVDAGFNCPPHQ